MSEQVPAKLLDLESCAELLGGVDESTVRRQIRDGKLVASRIGKRILVHPSDLADYQQRIPPRPMRRATWQRSTTRKTPSSAPKACKALTYAMRLGRQPRASRRMTRKEYTAHGAIVPVGMDTTAALVRLLQEI